MLQHDTNLFLDNTNILNLETNLNVELDKVSQWLFANKLSLNIEKTSFVVSQQIRGCKLTPREIYINTELVLS